VITGSGRRRERRRIPIRSRTLTALAAAMVSVVALDSCSSPASTALPVAPATSPVPPIPLSSSSAPPAATWATLAMGHLDDPLNTFWQLFDLSSGSNRWVLATPPGVASNGGLVASIAPSGSVLAGFEPTQDLLFSPLARSTDQGATWAPSVLPGALAPVPDSLVASSDGQELALLRGGRGRVVDSDTGMLSWKTVASERTLAADPSTSACGIEQFTAIGLGVADIAGGTGAAGTPVIGAACAHANHSGIFEQVGDDWVPVGPALPGAPVGQTEVIRILSTPNGAAVLVRAGTGSTTTLFAMWSTDGLKRWTISAGLPLAGGILTSTGTTTSGFVVAVTGADARRSASVVSPVATGWDHLVAPPAGTSTVVATPDGSFDALIASQSTLDVYTLGRGGWSRTQVLSVPIQYGSSG
jgi:hypothetical protein